MAALWPRTSWKSFWSLSEMLQKRTMNLEPYRQAGRMCMERSSMRVVDCGQALVSYTSGIAVDMQAVVVDCGQALVSYTDEHQRTHHHGVVDCGQALVSYTSGLAFCTTRLVVDCGQALVSYTNCAAALPGPRVVDCGQALVSYTSHARCPARRWLWIADRLW